MFLSFLYNLSFYTVLYLFIVFQTIDSSLLSRLKNTYTYESTVNIEMLPQDYVIDEFQVNNSLPNAFRAVPTEEVNYNTGQFKTYIPPVIRFRNNYENKYIWRPTLDDLEIRPTLPAEVIEDLESGRTKEDVVPEFKIRPTLPDNSSIVSTTTVTRTTLTTLSTTIRFTTIPTPISTPEVTTSPSRTWRTYFPTLTTTATLQDTHTSNISVCQIDNPQRQSTSTSEEISSPVKYVIIFPIVDSNTSKLATQFPYIINPMMRYHVLKKIILRPAWVYARNGTDFVEAEGIKMHNETASAEGESNTVHNKSAFVGDIANKTHTKRGVPRCFTCGLDTPGLSTSDCHDMFEGGDVGHRQNMYKKRTKCKGENVIGGCFKRYLDVGSTYYERGCRTKPPMKGKSYASKRLMYLEYLLHKVNDGCVASPHATLTPFSRSISLFARYHVCVCSQRYCNGAIRNFHEFSLVVLTIMLWL